MPFLHTQFLHTRAAHTHTHTHTHTHGQTERVRKR